MHTERIYTTFRQAIKQAMKQYMIIQESLTIHHRYFIMLSACFNGYIQDNTRQLQIQISIYRRNNYHMFHFVQKSYCCLMHCCMTQILHISIKVTGPVFLCCSRIYITWRQQHASIGVSLKPMHKQICGQFLLPLRDHHWKIMGKKVLNHACLYFTFG